MTIKVTISLPVPPRHLRSAAELDNCLQSRGILANLRAPSLLPPRGGTVGPRYPEHARQTLWRTCRYPLRHLCCLPTTTALACSATQLIGRLRTRDFMTGASELEECLILQHVELVVARQTPNSFHLALEWPIAGQSQPDPAAAVGSHRACYIDNLEPGGSNA